jgi:hypothetical protein
MGAFVQAPSEEREDDSTNPSISSEELANQRGAALALLASQGIGESSQYGAQAIGEASFYGAPLPPPPPPGSKGVPVAALISEVGATTVATSTSADLLDARAQAQKLEKIAEGHDERSERDRVTLGWTLAGLGIGFYLLGQFTHKYPIVVGSASIAMLIPGALMLFVGRSRLQNIERVRWLRTNGELFPARVLSVRDLGGSTEGRGNFSLRIEITHPARGAYDAMIRVELPAADLPREGTRLSVRVNPINPLEVIISS